MSSYGFSDAERFTIYTADGGKCFWCGIPLYYRDVQIDHVFPERLDRTPKEWAQVRADYGLGDDFTINSFENWVTCHQGCNLRKRGELLVNAPLTAFVIQQLVLRAPRLSKLRAEFEKDVKRSRAIVLLGSALRAGEVTSEDIQGLLVGLALVPVAPEPKQVPKPLWLAPDIGILQLTTPVGFTEKTLDLLRSREYVHAIIQAERAADGRYHDIVLWVTKEFAESAVEYARLHPD